MSLHLRCWCTLPIEDCILRFSWLGLNIACEASTSFSRIRPNEKIWNVEWWKRDEMMGKNESEGWQGEPIKWLSSEIKLIQETLRGRQILRSRRTLLSVEVLPTRWLPECFDNILASAGIELRYTGSGSDNSTGYVTYWVHLGNGSIIWYHVMKRKS